MFEYIRFMKLYKLLQIQSFFILFFGININYGQIPPGYYNSAEGLKGSELKAALNDIIDKYPPEQLHLPKLLEVV